jgi:pimeloyl-ACP methyl ester carboxylesterase
VESRFIEVEGLRLHFLEAGEGPAVLLLHGWPTQAALWRHAIPHIARHRRVIALDLPGYGRSDKPLDASYSFPFHDRILSGLLDALDLDQVGLGVHDIGGPIGLHWAVNNAERISSLAMLNTLVFPDMSAMVKLFIAATWLPGIRSLLTSPAGLAASMRFGVSNRSQITAEVEALYQEPFRDRAARAALLRAAHGLHPRGFETIAAGLTAFSDVPVCLLYGTADRILPQVGRTMARVAEILPHAKVTALDGCGHFLQEDQPEVVAEALAGFFAISGGRGTDLSSTA